MNEEIIVLPAIITASAAATKEVAAKLIKLIQPPAVFAMRGDLGAGKTTFVQGVIEYLAPRQKLRVQSPTFALGKSYPTHIPVNHIDLYRISEKASVVGLGIEEMIFDEEAFCLVEWPERYADQWPARTIWLNFSLLSENERSIEIFLPPILANLEPLIKKSIIMHI